MSKQYPLVRMADSSHAVGQFGRFEVLDELGRGAMGVVYRARDPLINRIVAIKTVSLGNQPPDTQSEYRERFRREAEAAGRLSHPGIVTVFDVGEELETRAPFIVMEYVEGYSLERSSKLTYQTVVRLIRDLAEAIDYAHAQNIVHRDLKPSNILVSEDGHAKIADFGVAKLNRSELTACGHILGTPAFMSPEQLNGGPIDGRSDIFSLGVILYTLLTGHRPFQGNSPLTVSFKVVHHEPVPATALNLTLPSEINQIVVRAMAKDPADRYQRGIDMAADLQNVLEHQLPKDESNRTGSSITDTGVHTEHVHTATSKIDQRLVTERQQMLTHIGSLLQKKWRRHGFWLLASILALCALALREPLRRLPQTASIEPSPMGPAVTDSSKPKTVLNPSVTIDHPAQYPLKTPSAVLQISVEPKFDQAKLTVWIDDHTVLRRNLTAVEKKTFRLIGGSRPTKLPNVYLAPGNHHVRVRLQSSAGLYDESHTVKAIFPEHSQRVLTVSFGKKKEMKVTLK